VGNTGCSKNTTIDFFFWPTPHKSECLISLLQPPLATRAPSEIMVLVCPIYTFHGLKIAIVSPFFVYEIVRDRQEKRVLNGDQALAMVRQNEFGALLRYFKNKTVFHFRAKLSQTLMPISMKFQKWRMATKYPK
jgi:hypothetical protein